jgi:hypothetical protein
VWVYVEIKPDGSEGIAGIAVPEAGTVLPLMAPRVRLLPKWDQLAAANARALGKRVELRRFGGPALTGEEFRPQCPARAGSGFVHY